ncbi:Regulatory protein tenI [uncultured Clostridium sp.]|nr:Regulatory protein tenI [uncultured Clostridium sp.]
MFKLICVTARDLCQEDFLQRIEKLACSRVDEIILREKDLDETAYRALADKVLPLCRRGGVPCTLHTYPRAAENLGLNRLHMPLPLLMEQPELRSEFDVLGTSVHSLEQARSAQELGVDYVTAGHIFPTDCKKGLPPRGPQWLREICRAFNGPVYAIGGIDEGNILSVRQAGASGACIMSGLMACEDVRAKVTALRASAGIDG